MGKETTAGKAGLGAAIGTIVVWFVGSVAGLPLPPEVQAALIVVTTYVVTYVVPADATVNDLVGKE